MTSQRSTRSIARLTLRAALATSLSLLGMPAKGQATQPPAPIERRTPPPHAPASATPNAAERHGVRGEHLSQWLTQHSDLTPQQQEKALEREPGFRELPQDTQQRMRNRLAQLDAMSPEQRQRRLAHIEAMERLNPDQRSQVRGAMSQLGSLPPDERHTVAQTFRALRELPQGERVQAYASGRYGPPLTDSGRNVLMNLLRVEPMIEAATPTPAQPQPR